MKGCRQVGEKRIVSFASQALAVELVMRGQPRASLVSGDHSVKREVVLRHLFTCGSHDDDGGKF